MIDMKRHNFTFKQQNRKTIADVLHVNFVPFFLVMVIISLCRILKQSVDHKICNM